MKMKKIKYTRLYSFGEYENESFGLEDEFDDDSMSDEDAIALLRMRTDAMHAHNNAERAKEAAKKRLELQLEDAQDTLCNREASLEATTHRIIQLKATIDELKKKLGE